MKSLFICFSLSNAIAFSIVRLPCVVGCGLAIAAYHRVTGALVMSNAMPQGIKVSE